MAAGWEALGQVLGGGINREAAFMEGQLHSAKTQEAIARAKLVRDQQAAIAELSQLAPDVLTGTDAPLGKIMAAGLGTDYAGVTQGRLRNQEYTNRATLGDELATAAARQAAGDAVQGKYSAFRMVGKDHYYDPTNISAGPQALPLGDALANSKAPMSIQEWREYSTWDPATQQKYLQMKRASDRITDVNGVPTVVTVGPERSVTPLSTVESEADAAARVQRAKAQATNTAEADVKALETYPAAMARADETIRLLDELENHPGLSGAVGVKYGMEYLPATDEADFVAKADQLGGQQFLQAFESLRGAGAITEHEGKKAETAISTIQNRRQSEASYRKAIGDLKRITENARIRIEERHQRALSTQTPTGTGTGAASATSSPTPAPPASPPGPPKAPPERNAKGWVLMKDANGRQAYVSPDRTQYEELQ